MLPQSQGSVAGPAWYPSSTGVPAQPAPAAPPAGRPRSPFLMSIVDSGAILGGAARLWWRHWPVLFALCLFGIGAKQWLLQAGVSLSRTNATLGLLAFITGPLVLLASFVLMLMAVGRAESGGLRARASISVLSRQLTSLVIPFIGVYAALGLLRSDVDSYYYQIWYSDPFDANMLSRLPFYTQTSLVVALVVVVVLRWLVPRWQFSRAWLVVAVISAYLEFLWVGGAARWLSPGAGLLADRQVDDWLSTGWARLADALGPLHGETVWVGQQLGHADLALLAPVAWLVLGLVIYRGGTAPSEDNRDQVTPPRWLAKMPGPVRWFGHGVQADLRTRFGPLSEGVGAMFRGGLIPMVVLCVAVTALVSASRWLWEIERFLIGPRDLWTRWAPISDWLSPLNDAITFVAVTCVVAAAVQRIRQRGIRLLGAADEPATTAE